MRYDIVAGEELRKIMASALVDPIPFNEDMSKGSYTYEPFTEGFIKERASVHSVSEQEYSEKLGMFFTFLSKLSLEDEVHLHFGVDQTCLANRAFLIEYLKPRCGKIVLHIVNEYTGEELKKQLIKG